MSIGIVLAIAAATSAPPPPSLFPSVDETRAEFEAVCRRLHTSASPYFGRTLAERIEARLRTENAAALDAEIRVGMRGRLAHELLRLGEPERAADLLAQALEIADEHGLSAELRARLLSLSGMAQLQLAEDRNCVEMHGARSCILPIAEEGIHRFPERARRAAEFFRRQLAIAPDDPQARWLLNLTQMVAGNYPDGVPQNARLPAGTLDGPAGWEAWPDRAPALGTDAFDLAGGAILDDFDGDGLLDLATSTWDPCGPLKAFRNRGDGRFEDVAEAWGLTGQLGGLNLVQADYDNDGRLDLLVLRGGWMGDDGRIRNSLLRNDLHASGRFVDVTAAAGLAYPAYPTQTAAWADFDGDGDLDLYVGNESPSGQVYSWSLVQNPGRAFPSQLFRNNGPRDDGVVTFTDVARAAGVSNRRYAKGVAWGDVDNDGDPDLYVSNIGPNRLYRNNGPGVDGQGVTFTDVAPELGVTAPETSSFATWFFDADNDGDLDLFVTDYSAAMSRVSASYLGLTEPGETGHPRLYLNTGGRFRDASQELGLTRPLLPMGANFGDLDNDGWLDFVLGTGIPNLEALMPDVAYRNEGGGRFTDVTFAVGLGHLQKGHGVAFGDLDNDGDQDLLRQIGGAFPSDGFTNALFENPSNGVENPGNGHHWLSLHLHGRQANRFGLGARVEVQVKTQTGSLRSIHRQVGSSGSFGGSSLRLEIGLGDAAEIVAVTVRWPGSDTVQRFEGVRLDQAYRMIEGEPALEPLDLPRFQLQTETLEQRTEPSEQGTEPS